MKIMPILETVAGEACCRLSVSKRKLTLVPNWMRSPEGIVSSRLSSSTEFSASIHSGSMSPSQTIQRCTEVSLITWILKYFLGTFEMDFFSTHLSSSHSDDSILPLSRVHIHVSEQLKILNLLILWKNSQPLFGWWLWGWTRSFWRQLRTERVLDAALSRSCSFRSLGGRRWRLPFAAEVARRVGRLFGAEIPKSWDPWEAILWSTLRFSLKLKL